MSFTLIVCETDDVFPHASVKDHVRTIVNEFGQDPGVIASTPVAVISPLHASVAVREIIAGTSDAHCTLAVGGADGATGGVESFTLIVAEVVAELPHASVAVKITFTAPEQLFGIDAKLFVHVTVEHESEATAPPFEANQLCTDPPLLLSHCAVRFEAGVVITGGVLSCTLIVCVAVEELQPSDAVQVRIIV